MRFLSLFLFHRIFPFLEYKKKLIFLLKHIFAKQNRIICQGTLAKKWLEWRQKKLPFSTNCQWQMVFFQKSIYTRHRQQRSILHLILCNKFFFHLQLFFCFSRSFAFVESVEIIFFPHPYFPFTPVGKWKCLKHFLLFLLSLSTFLPIFCCCCCWVPFQSFYGSHPYYSSIIIVSHVFGKFCAIKFTH